MSIRVMSESYTNNFWPMDSSPTWGANGHDIKFGNYSLLDRRKYTEWVALPQSDDGLDHNSYFGMNYEVEFTLSPDYLGMVITNLSITYSVNDKIVEAMASFPKIQK